MEIGTNLQGTVGWGEPATFSPDRVMVSSDHSGLGVLGYSIWWSG